MSRSHRRIPALGLVALLVAACGGPPATTSGDVPSVPASPATSRAPEASVFSFPGGDTPNVTRELAGFPDESYINPGAVLVDDDGTFHMFANAFTAWPGTVSFPHLTSTDGVAWTLSASSPAFTSEDVPFAEPGADVSTGFIADDGTWTLVLGSVNFTDPWAIGRATAPGPDGPWTIDPEPILTAGAEGDWDAGGLSWPSVVRGDEGWAMYYAAAERPRTPTQAIGLATSTDGITWTKHPEPVLEPGATWDAAGIDRPRVQRTDAGWLMIYAGAGQSLSDRGLAWSDDGVSWTPDPANPVLGRDDFPIQGNTWDTALLVHDGELRYYMEIGSAGGGGTTDIYLATAPADLPRP